jgi:hypothetical protein
MKNNYPIKYAVIPIDRQVGWSSREYDSDCPEGYIASKCYLVNEKKEYCANGESEITYEVVFPYHCNGSRWGWKRVEPQYDYYHEAYPSILVANVYDNREDAVKIAKAENHELLIKKMFFIHFSNPHHEEEMAEISKKHEEKMAEFKKLEQLIEDGTGDLVVGQLPKEQTVIIYDYSKNGDSSKNGKLSSSLYSVIGGSWHNTNFCVYNLTNDEYEQIMMDIQEGKPVDKYKTRCLMINNPINQALKINNYNKANDSAYLISGVLTFVKDDNIPEENFNESNSKVNFFTLETYEDIIESLVTKYKDGEELSLDNKVMAKVLKFKR